MSAENGKGQRGKPGQVPWREDKAILDRMEEVADLRMGGKSYPAIALALSVSLATAHADWQRWKELYAERVEDRTEEHVANLEALKRKVLALIDDTANNSLNKSALVAQLRAIEMDMAKLDGSLVERKETKLEAEGLTFTLNLKPE